MTMRKLIGTVLLLCAGAGAQAQQVGGGEQLFLIPPAGWTIAYHDTKGAVELTELTPPGQTAQNWTDMLTVELILGHPASDVQAMLTGRLETIHQDCSDVGAGQTQLAVENGYDTGIRAVACPKTKKDERGEISLYKVILGKDRTYVVSRAWSGKSYDKDKIPLPAQTTQEWIAFMSKVVVCDPRERTHPCPSTSSLSDLTPRRDAGRIRASSSAIGLALHEQLPSD